MPIGTSSVSGSRGRQARLQRRVDRQRRGAHQQGVAVRPRLGDGGGGDGRGGADPVLHHDRAGRVRAPCAPRRRGRSRSVTPPGAYSRAAWRRRGRVGALRGGARARAAGRARRRTGRGGSVMAVPPFVAAQRASPQAGRVRADVARSPRERVGRDAPLLLRRSRGERCSRSETSPGASARGPRWTPSPSPCRRARCSASSGARARESPPCCA